MGNFKNAVYITKKLMSALNLKDYQAVGFAGNWMQESGCEPGSYNKEEKNGTFSGSSANGAGYGAGLAQWSNTWKQKIQNYFNRHTPIEQWTMDQQLDIVIKCCVPAYINLLRNCANAADSTDIVLRGYENGSGGYGTSLRSKQSMASYTWAKTVYMADGSKRTFSDGYQGLICSRVSFSQKILQLMGNYSAAELANIGNMAGDFGGGEGGEGGGGFSPPTPEDIQRAIYEYQHAYPVHSEYTTYSGAGGNLYTNAKENAFSTAVLSENRQIRDQDYFTSKTTEHTRIYSTNDSCIVLDELKINLDSSTLDTWSNKGVDQAAVDKWKKEQDKAEEEAKKKAEEEKKKAEEEAKKKAEEEKKKAEGNTDTSTNKDSKDKDSKESKDKNSKDKNSKDKNSKDKNSKNKK